MNGTVTDNSDRHMSEEEVDSTEILQPGKLSMPGPRLPTPVSFHCLVKLNSTTAFLIGGWQGYDALRNKETFFLDLTGNGPSWTRGPDLNHARSSHACTIVRDPVDGSELVAAVAGWNSSHSLDSTEVMQLTFSVSIVIHCQDHTFTLQLWNPSSNSWSMGPRLPFPLDSASAVTDNNGRLILIGGKTNGSETLASLRSLTCSNQNCHWSLLDQTLDQPRYYSVALLVPDNYLPCN